MKLANNRMNFAVIALASIGLMGICPAQSAHSEDDINRHLISNPSIAAYTIYGNLTKSTVKDGKVQGGSAVEVTVAGEGNPWDSGAQVMISKPIKKGDEIVCVAWLKGKSDSGAPVKLHGRLQVNVTPYNGLGETDFSVTDQWQLYTLKVVADQDYLADKLSFSVHLNTAKQTITLGPAFILDMTRTF